MRTSWLLLAMCLAAPGAAQVALAAEEAKATGAKAAPAPPHRPLRQNVPAAMPVPTDPEIFDGYSEAPPFKVVPQKDKLTIFPCTQCHKHMPPNPEPRKLQAPHQSALNHGEGRMWCLNCHLIDDRDYLHTIRQQKVDFNDAYLVCGQCHANRQQDWYFGAHGKRVSNWQGERLVYSCTHCHDPHDPTLKPRAPNKAPAVRAGLERMDRPESEGSRVWERLLETKGGTP
jgi:hypothetical protein